MSFAFELSFDDSVTVGQVARYLELLRTVGATDDTVLEEVHPYQDGSMLVGWVYRSQQLLAPSERAELSLPVPVVRDALDMLSTILESEGDVRDLLSSVEKVRDALQKSVMQEVGFPEVEV